jgi:O-acetyl-ADP-ribose deacetylase
VNRLTVNKCTLLLVQGDITKESTGAIVNAANSGLLGGGGVDGAIHRAGGPAILEACREIRKIRGPLPTGEAVITTGGKLKARFVIHTVGPVWQGGDAGEDSLLASAYTNSLQLALENNVTSIAFPSISTGVYGFPIERASRIAFDTVTAFLRKNEAIEEVRFVTYSAEDFATYAQVFHVG